MLELSPIEDHQALRQKREVKLYFDAQASMPWSFAIVDGMGSPLITSNQSYSTQNEAQAFADWSLRQLD